MGETIKYGLLENNDALKADYWKLQSLLITDALHHGGDHVALIRFDLFEDCDVQMKKQMSQVLHPIVNLEAQNILSDHASLTMFNDFSYLIITRKDNAESALVQGHKLCQLIETHLHGGAFHGMDLSLWHVRGVNAQGLNIEPLTMPTEVIQTQEISVRVASDNQPEGLTLLGKASFDYLPVWNVRKNVVSSFECIPRWHLDDGEILDEADLSQRFQAHDMEYALDAQTMDHAVDQIVDVIEHDAMATIIVPVHYDTVVEDAGFSHFIRAYNNLTSVWRDRISMEIKCIPEQAGFEDVHYAVRRLQPYCALVYLQVPFGFDLFGDFGGNVCIGLDVTHDRRDEVEIIADMESFIARAANFGAVHTHIFGLQTVSMSVAAICAGFDYIGSHPIDKELEGWGLDDFLIKPIDLYKRLLKSKK